MPSEGQDLSDLEVFNLRAPHFNYYGGVLNEMLRTGFSKGAQAGETKGRGTNKFLLFWYNYSHRASYIIKASKPAASYDQGSAIIHNTSEHIG